MAEMNKKQEVKEMENTSTTINNGNMLAYMDANKSFSIIYSSAKKLAEGKYANTQTLLASVQMFADAFSKLTGMELDYNGRFYDLLNSKEEENEEAAIASWKMKFPTPEEEIMNIEESMDKDMSDAYKNLIRDKHMYRIAIHKLWKAYYNGTSKNDVPKAEYKLVHKGQWEAKSKTWLNKCIKVINALNGKFASGKARKKISSYEEENKENNAK